MARGRRRRKARGGTSLLSNRVKPAGFHKDAAIPWAERHGEVRILPPEEAADYAAGLTRRGRFKHPFSVIFGTAA